MLRSSQMVRLANHTRAQLELRIASKTRNWIENYQAGPEQPYTPRATHARPHITRPGPLGYKPPPPTHRPSPRKQTQTARAAPSLFKEQQQQQQQQQLPRAFQPRLLDDDCEPLCDDLPDDSRLLLGEAMSSSRVQRPWSAPASARFAVAPPRPRMTMEIAIERRKAALAKMNTVPYGPENKPRSKWEGRTIQRKVAGLHLLRPFEAGHETVIEHQMTGHLQVVPALSPRPPLPSDQQVAHEVAGRLGVHVWTSGRRAPSLRAEFHAGVSNAVDGGAHGGMLEFRGAKHAAAVAGTRNSRDSGSGSGQHLRGADTLISLPDKAATAIDSFDVQHRSSALAAGTAYGSLSGKETHLHRKEAMKAAIRSMMRDRAHVIEKTSTTTRIVGKQRVKKSAAAKRLWRLEDSIWAPRVKWCDSKAFYDTPHCVRAAFESDWKHACRALTKFIERHDDGTDAGGIDEVTEVADVLWEHHDLLYLLFTFYAASGASDDIFRELFRH